MRLPANLGARAGAAAPRPSLRDNQIVGRVRDRLRDERGFTIVEVIVATVILTVGLLTTFMMLSIALHSSSDVRQRENGVALARQVAEDARSIPYSQLSGSTITSTLQGYPGLANTSTSGSTWTVKRAGYTYTLTDSLTGLQDLTKDPTGNTVVKQFTVNVTWTAFQGKSYTYTESAIMSRAGQDPGLQASSLALASPAFPTGGLSGSTTAPVITSAGITSLQFSVTAPAGTQAVVWTLNGAKQTAWSGSAPSSGTTWTSNSWSLSGVSDGTYTIGAAAEDSSGIDGPAVTMTVRLIRNVPSAPTVTGYGFNANLPGGPASAAEFQWNANPENNIVGYRIYYNGADICQTSLNTSYQSCGVGGHSAWCLSPTQCVDLAPPATSASNLTYTVKALYYDASNNLQEGTGQNVTLASGAPVPPAPPATVSLGVQVQPDDTAILTWTPSVGTVSFYRIYRDGNSYTQRYDTLSASSCSLTTCTYHDTNRGSPHGYYISAVGGTTPGANMAESALVGPVSG